jgi:Tol biopolymer transport system component
MIDKAANASVPAGVTGALSDRYRIERELGIGGMATVYLAQDIKHARKVAVKVLHPDLAAALGAERFLAEIKTTANLQHPHILSLHDSGEADGLLFYVMPFVDGESLRDRLSREKQLPLEDALRIAREVADALGYAHSHGVIHRDIKPENILLQSGHALVADFGIALAVQSAGGQRMTQTGLSLGTPQYMSPEQAMGERAIDARSDIYALGAVAYEMLAGDPPFTGSTVQSIVAKVLTEKPPSLTAVRETVTPATEHAVLRALSKLPADRWPTAHAFAEALIAPSGSMPRDARGTSPLRRSSTSRALTVTQSVVTLLAIGAAIWFARRQAHDASPRGAIRFVVDAGTVERFNVTGTQPFAISPDGRIIAYVGSGVDRRIFVRSLGDVMPRPLVGTSNASAPFFSPDGRWIAYFVSATGGTVLAPGKLVKVPVDGGAVVEIAPSVQGLGGAWLPDGRIVLATQGSTGGLSIVSASGGSPARLIEQGIPGDRGIHRWPRLLPDGETILFASWNASVFDAHVGITSLRSHRTKILDIAGAIPLTVVDGFLLYMQPSGAIMAIAFDAQSWTTHGEAIPVLEGSSQDGLGAVRVAISSHGDLVYATGADQLQLVLADAQGKMTPLLSKPGVYSSPRFSPDGRRIALDIATTATDVWIYDRVGGTLDRITNTGAADRPEWMPDSKRIFFRLNKPGSTALYSTSTDGGGAVDSMQAFKEGIHEGTIGPDGRSLVFRTATAGGGRDIWSVRLGTGESPRAVLATPAQEMQPRLSSDGRWLAYTSDESGVLEIYVRPFPGEGGRVRVSTDGGTEPMWSRDGLRLFYRSGDRLMAAHVTRAPQFSVIKREIAFEGAYVVSTPHANYDVSPDGKSFVMIAPASGGTQMVMVLDWFDDVRARIAGRGKAR